MRSLLALVALGLLGVGVAACGGSHSTRVTPAVHVSAATDTHPDTSPAAPSPVSPSQHALTATARDRARYDRDEDDYVHVPDDNNPSPPGYVTASSADGRAATAVVRRYYADALKGDGAKGCLLITPSFVKGIPVDYGKLGPSYLRRAASTCAAVMSLLFKHEHSLLAHEVPVMRIVRVSVSGVQGLVFMRFGPLHERFISLARQGNAWTIASVLDGEAE
jgi:hypothetical protein